MERKFGISLELQFPGFLLAYDVILKNQCNSHKSYDFEFELKRQTINVFVIMSFIIQMQL